MGIHVPPEAVAVSIVGWALLLEATRRSGGTAVFVVVGLISLYPVYAELMPGPISGLGQDLYTTMAYHFTSSESVLGIPMRAFGELVIGFVMFGAVLQFTGASEFLITSRSPCLGVCVVVPPRWLFLPVV